MAARRQKMTLTLTIDRATLKEANANKKAIRKQTGSPPVHRDTVHITALIKAFKAN
jgi:hypothetical protein